jgi:ribonuclease HI
MPKVIIYTDGGARNNPGPAGAGIVIIDGAKRFELKKFLGERQTNNWAEYEAVALALAEAKKRGLGGTPDRGTARQSARGRTAHWKLSGQRRDALAAVHESAQSPRRALQRSYIYLYSAGT